MTSTPEDIHQAVRLWHEGHDDARDGEPLAEDHYADYKAGWLAFHHIPDPYQGAPQ